jgi:hypothetical protein
MSSDVHRRRFDIARTAAGDYGPLAVDVLNACTEVLEGFDVPAEQYTARFERALPRWFRDAAPP